MSRIFPAHASCRHFVVAVIAWLPLLVAGATLSQGEAEQMARGLAGARLETLRVERKAEVEARTLVVADHTMRWLDSTHGKCGKRGWPLWISLHGGGEVPSVVNDEQWRKHATLYQPANGIYVAPRAPSDHWFMRNEALVDPLIERLIEDLIALRGVDPDRVYLLGYSAGGNGVYHLAPRMADRFAAAATMAGYPTGAPLLSLCNLPFAILVGRHDITFDRVKEAETWQAEFSARHRNDPAGYRHFIRIYPEYGHWMHGEDAEALPWMDQFTRNPWPKKLVWVQDEVPRPRFYWLETFKEGANAGRRLTAEVKQQQILLNGDGPLGIKLWLSDQLLDLDQPVSVQWNGEVVFRGIVHRSEGAIRASLGMRCDLPACASAVLELTAGTPEAPSVSSP